jgi:hypothetical protein
VATLQEGVDVLETILEEYAGIFIEFPRTKSPIKAAIVELKQLQKSQRLE